MTLQNFITPLKVREPSHCNVIQLGLDGACYIRRDQEVFGDLFTGGKFFRLCTVQPTTMAEVNEPAIWTKPTSRFIGMWTPRNRTNYDQSGSRLLLSGV